MAWGKSPESGNTSNPGDQGIRRSGNQEIRRSGDQVNIIGHHFSAPVKNSILDIFKNHI